MMSGPELAFWRDTLSYPEENPFFTDDITEAAENVVLLPINGGTAFNDFQRQQSMIWFNELRYIGSDQQAQHAIDEYGLDVIVYFVDSMIEHDMGDQPETPGNFNIVRACRQRIEEANPDGTLDPRALLGVFVTLLDVYDQPRKYAYIPSAAIAH